MNTRVFNVTHVRYIRHLLIVPILLSDYQARLRRNIPHEPSYGIFAYMSWWHYGMALLSALLPLFAWKPRVSGGLSAQRSYKTKIFYSFNKLFNKELKLLEISDAMAPCEVNLIIHKPKIHCNLNSRSALLSYFYQCGVLSTHLPSAACICLVITWPSAGLLIIHDRLLNRSFRRRSKEKTSKLRATGLCVGKIPVTGEFPAQMATNAENVSIWWRHYALETWGK